MNEKQYTLSENTAAKVKVLVNAVDLGTGPTSGPRATKPVLWVEVTGGGSGGTYAGTIQSTADGLTWTDHATDAIVRAANSSDVLEAGKRYLGVRAQLDEGVWTVVVTTGGGGGGTLVNITGDRDGSTGYYPGRLVTDHDPGTDTYTYGEAVWFTAANDGDIGMVGGSGYFHGTNFGHTVGEGEDERPVYIGDSWGEIEVEEVDPEGTPTLTGDASLDGEPSLSIECEDGVPVAGTLDWNETTVSLSGVSITIPTVTRAFRGVGLVAVP